MYSYSEVQSLKMKRGRSCGESGFGADVFWHTAHVSSAEHTLQWPQHNDNKQHHKHNKEHHPFPVCQPTQTAKSPMLRVDWSTDSLGANVDADAEWRRAVRGARASVRPGGFVAQLLPLKPHRLLLLQVAGQPAEDLAAGGQGRGTLLRQRGGLTAEGAREASAATVTFLVSLRDGH